MSRLTDADLRLLFSVVFCFKAHVPPEDRAPYQELETKLDRIIRKRLRAPLLRLERLRALWAVEDHVAELMGLPFNELSERYQKAFGRRLTSERRSLRAARKLAKKSIHRVRLAATAPAPPSACIHSETKERSPVSVSGLTSPASDGEPSD
jgi:hypothetical protein